MLFSKIKGLPTLDAFGFKITRVMSERDKRENSPAHTSMVIVTERIANCDPMVVKTLTKADDLTRERARVERRLTP